MDISKKLARLLGPSITVVVAAELPFIQPGLYDQQTPPGVYVSGMMMFVAGLAIVLSHNIWVRDWRILNTLAGWSILGLGLIRLFTATTHIAAAKDPSSGFYIALEAALILIGLLLSYCGYRPERMR